MLCSQCKVRGSVSNLTGGVRLGHYRFIGRRVNEARHTKPRPRDSGPKPKPESVWIKYKYRMLMELMVRMTLCVACNLWITVHRTYRILILTICWHGRFEKHSLLGHRLGLAQLESL